MIYLDTGILVRALLASHPDHLSCEQLLTRDAVTSFHALAEAFNTLTGFFKVPNDLAGESVDSIADRIRLEPIILADYSTILRNARQKSVQGGIIYDALHAQVARRLKVEKLITFNLSNFRHVAPDLIVAVP